MKWISAISEEEVFDKAVMEVIESLRLGLQNETPQLLISFVSPHHLKASREVAKWIQHEFPLAHHLGCSAGGVIGHFQEIERSPGFAMMAAILPNVSLTPLRFQNEDFMYPLQDRKSWEKKIGVPFEKNPHFLLLADPMSFEIEKVLKGFDVAYPWSKKIGGMASGGSQNVPHLLYLDGEVYEDGMIGMALSGNIRVESIVAQGCRPIGASFAVTACDQNIIFELDGMSPMQVLQELYPRLEPREQELFKHSLFLGIEMGNDASGLSNEFLIRNILGVDAASGGLVVSAALHINQRVRFYVRDALSSAEDLEHQLQRFSEQHSDFQPAGALLFSCMGRGKYLYGQSHHDSKLFHQTYPGIALGGFFCNGEIGPLHGKTFLHGYSSSFAIFSPRY
ncbi:MAG: FIST C-terminal domain-containing protein [Deltaproteobacteria bacterium]|nr:FIST C-terminal domain-containing protein [Deltaproteobacteria bacterium]